MSLEPQVASGLNICMYYVCTYEQCELPLSVVQYTTVWC